MFYWDKTYADSARSASVDCARDPPHTVVGATEVHRSALPHSAKLRQPSNAELLSSSVSFGSLRLVFGNLPISKRTHDPLVPGSSPGGPTTHDCAGDWEQIDHPRRVNANCRLLIACVSLRTPHSPCNTPAFNWPANQTVDEDDIDLLAFPGTEIHRAGQIDELGQIDNAWCACQILKWLRIRARCPGRVNPASVASCHWPGR